MEKGDVEGVLVARFKREHAIGYIIKSSILHLEHRGGNLVDGIGTSQLNRFLDEE